MKKLIFWIAVLVLIAAGILGYNRFMHGELKIDRELVSEENFDLLADNWEKLGNGETNNSTTRLALESPENAIAWAYIYDEAPVPYTRTATYDRYSLLEMLAAFVKTGDFAEFINTSNTFVVGNDRIALVYWEIDAVPNADQFENWFKGLISKVQS